MMIMTETLNSTNAASEEEAGAFRLQEREKELVAEFQNGRTSSFDALVTLLAPRLFRVAFGMLGNKQDAEEVVQDAFVRAYKALPDFRGDASFDTWMYRITVNLSRNKYHWNRRRGDGVNVSLSAPLSGDEDDKVQEIDVPDTRPEPDRLMETEELESHIMKGINALPESLRETMVLRHLEDMSYEQIADLLDCKVGTVKSRLARGREMLREYILSLEHGRSGKSKNSY